MGSYIEKISDNVLSTKFENISKDKLDNAKYRIIDVLGCIISGANAPNNYALIDMVKTWGGAGKRQLFSSTGARCLPIMRRW